MVFYDPSPLGLEYAEVAERAAELERPLSVSGSRLIVRSNAPSSESVSCASNQGGLGPLIRCISKLPQKQSTISSP